VRARREGKHRVYFVDDPHVVDIVRVAIRHHGELDDPHAVLANLASYLPDGPTR